MICVNLIGESRVDEGVLKQRRLWQRASYVYICVQTGCNID